MITIDVESPIGEVRTLIGDSVEGDGVKPGGGNFTDAEITYFLEREKTVSRAAALACETLAYLWNIYPEFEADGLRVDHSTVSAGWWRAANRFRANVGARAIPLRRESATG